MKKIIKFYTSTCGPCKIQTEWLKKLENVEIQNVDIEDDDSMELMIKYKVRNVPTLVLLDDTDEVLRVFHGLTEIDEINKVIDFYNKKQNEVN